MISAVVLAAGQSRRMGQPKMCLPWGKTTILGHIAATLSAAGVDEILIVTGGARLEVEELVHKLANRYPVRTVHNYDYAQSDMLGSIQAGLRKLTAEVEAALVALGDQPQVREGTVRGVLEAYRQNHPSLVIPSYNQRRGHPWLADRLLWPAILALGADQTPRDFLNAQQAKILYMSVADDSILRDVDTPEQYEAERPEENP